MHRRTLVWALAVVFLLVAPAAALAARVTIRVEGKTQTIFAPAPRAVDATNALQALELASLAGSSTTTSRRRASAPTSTRSAASPPRASPAGCSR